MYRQVIAVSFLLALAATPLNALDTGHHFDLTRAALSRREFGFSDRAIGVDTGLGEVDGHERGSAAPIFEETLASIDDLIERSLAS